MVLAALLFIKRMSDESFVSNWTYVDSVNDQDSLDLKIVPKNVRVYEVSGPMFFGAAERILEISFKEYTECLILRMRAVPSLDASAMNSLEQLLSQCQQRGVRLILSHVNPQPLEVMKKSGFYEKVGEDNFCLHIDDALHLAQN